MLKISKRGFRSLLYVPGNSQKMLLKSIQSQADALVPDCEDSVPLDQKATARKLINEELLNMHTSFAKPIYPRPNDLHSGFFQDDINKIIDPVTVKAIDGIMVPKVDTPEDMREID